MWVHPHYYYLTKNLTVCRANDACFWGSVFNVTSAHFTWRDFARKFTPVTSGTAASPMLLFRCTSDVATAKSQVKSHNANQVYSVLTACVTSFQQIFLHFVRVFWRIIQSWGTSVSGVSLCHSSRTRAGWVNSHVSIMWIHCYLETIFGNQPGKYLHFVLLLCTAHIMDAFG